MENQVIHDVTCRLWAIIAALICGFTMECSRPDAVRQASKGAVCVEGEWITHEEIARAAEAFRSMPSRVSAVFEAPDSAAPLRDAARQLILHRIMLHQVKLRGIKPDTAAAQRMFGLIRKRFADEAAFQRELTLQGQTEESLKKQIGEGLLVDTLMKSIAATVDTPSVEECRKYYNENPAKFSARKMIRLSQIFIAAPSTLDEEEKKAARSRADEILKRLASGADFGNLAREKSQGPEASSQGDMGWFSPGDLNSLFAVPASALVKGQTSGVISSEHGYHILKKTDEKPMAGEPFDKARPQIEQYLFARKANERLKTFVDSLISSAKIIYADTAFAQVMEDRLPRP